jgi:hypothetical protein
MAAVSSSILEAALHGALFGGLTGAAIGVLPLLLLLYHRERNRALLALVACTVAGAVGGYLAAIVGAGLFAAPFVRKRQG